MHITRAGSQPSSRGPADWFTGTVRMTHVAVQEQLDGKAVEWLEQVTDEQYAGR